MRNVAIRKCIRSNHPITYQRYEKGNRHTPRSIRNIPHDYWSNRTTHYRHDEQRRSKLGLCTRIPQCQREYRRKHDALSQIQGEKRNERQGSATYHHNQCGNEGEDGTSQQHQPWLDIIHDDTTSQPADKEQTHSAKGEIQTGSLLLYMNALLSIVDEETVHTRLGSHIKKQGQHTKTECHHSHRFLLHHLVRIRLMRSPWVWQLDP